MRRTRQTRPTRTRRANIASLVERLEGRTIPSSLQVMDPLDDGPACSTAFSPEGRYDAIAGADRARGSGTGRGP